MSMKVSPLKETNQDLHRFWFMVNTKKQWYSIIHECRYLFGSEWKGQAKVLKKLDNPWAHTVPLRVWFEVPDDRFATWVALKHGIEVCSDYTNMTNK